MSSGLDSPSSTALDPQEICQEAFPQVVAGNYDHKPGFNEHERSGLSSSWGSQSGSGYDEQSQESLSKPLPCEQNSISKHEVGWRRVVRNFAPSWFAVTMGTGMASMLFYSLPYNAAWLYWISVVIFAFNVLLFSLGLLIMMVRFTLYPEIFRVMVTHPVQSMFIGTFPMGFCTIITMFVYLCVPVWGSWAKSLALAMWIVDVIVAVASALCLPFMMMTRRDKTELSEMTAAWLLPIVTTVVAAATGGIVADVLDDPYHALWTVIVSYVLWGIGVPLAMMVLAIYFQRLALHKLPPREVIVTVFLPMGPLGQGGYGILKLGEISSRVFPQTETLHPITGPVLYALGFIVSLILWSLGLAWLFFAVASIAKTRNFPFNIGWWGFTFPLGVYASSTVLLGQSMPSAFFRVLGTILSVCVIILWMVVTFFTFRGIASGEMIHAPCLKDMKKEKPQEGEKAA